MWGRRHAPRSPRLKVDPTSCTGVAMCAHVAPALIELDRWGFPKVPRGEVERRDIGTARAAVRACPRRALLLIGEQDDA